MKKEQILAECIANVKTGRSTVEDCVAQHPEFGRELRPLLEIALGLRPTSEAATPEFKARARAAVRRAMQEDEPAAGRGWARHLQPVPSLKAATVAIAMLAAVVVAGSGTAYASQRALPGDKFYPVKTGMENVQLALTPGHEAKALLHLKLAERRVDEAARQAGTERGPSVAAPTSVANQLDGGIREISKSNPEAVKNFMQRLADSSLRGELTVAAVTSGTSPPAISDTAAVLRRSQLIAEVSYDNPAFLGAGPSVLDKDLDAGRFKVTGTLTGVDNQSWKINGVPLGNVNYAGVLPPVDSSVQTEGITKNGKTFITSVQTDGNTDDEVTVEGVVKGADGGLTVGGIPVTVTGGASLPQEGNEARLRGTAKDGKVSVSQVETQQAGDVGIQLEGTLISMDPGGKTVLVKRAGTQVKVGIAEAQIETQDGQSLSFSQLQSVVERGVQINGLSRKDGTLYAKQIIVDARGRDVGPRSR